MYWLEGQLELLNAGKLNDINETNDEQYSVEGEEIEENLKIHRPVFEEAHPELNVDSHEEQKKTSYNLMIKKVFIKIFIDSLFYSNYLSIKKK